MAHVEPHISKPSAQAHTDVALTEDGSAILTIRRVFPVSPERLFRAFADGAELGKWFGPETHTCTVHHFDCRPGGSYRLIMQSEGGPGLGLRGRFSVVEPPKQLSFSWIWDGDGGMGERETFVDLAFHPHGTHCQLVLTHSLFPGEEQAEQHQTGWLSSFVCLEKELSETTQ